MQANAKCRFAIHLGTESVSFVKVERNSAGWQVVGSGELPWHSYERTPDPTKPTLATILKHITQNQSISREPIHVSLHSRYCVTRVVTGDLQQVEKQLEEIIANSHHYLQFGLGDKLIGQSNTIINESQQYGQVAIIKRGVFEAVEKALHSNALELGSIDGGMPSLSRLIGLSGLDEVHPILFIWLTEENAEIGISHQGRLQLTYQLGGGCGAEQVAETIRKHMKRLQRFCSRYRSVDGDGSLVQAIVLATENNAAKLRSKLEGVAFEHVYMAQELSVGKLAKNLTDSNHLSSPGIASALGGLLVHLEENTLPTTNILANYVDSKPRTLLDIAMREGWMVLAAAAVLLVVSAYSWYVEHRINHAVYENEIVSMAFESDREKISALDAARSQLEEFKAVRRYSQQVDEDSLIHFVATCLPEDTRIDSLTVDAQGKMILKGAMLHGDKTYEVLKSLRDSPLITEVALESVGKASNFGQTATMFEIHCFFAITPVQSLKKVAMEPHIRRASYARN
jgi:hypothetical protein